MKYKVTLNKRVYEVEVEQGEAMLVDEYDAVAPVPAAAPVAAAPVAAAPVAAAAPAPAAAAPAAVAAGEVVKSQHPEDSGKPGPAGKRGRCADHSRSNEDGK